MKDTNILVFVAIFFIGYYIGSHQTPQNQQPNQYYQRGNIRQMELKEGHCGFCPDDCEPRTNRCKR